MPRGDGQEMLGRGSEGLALEGTGMGMGTGICPVTHRCQGKTERLTVTGRVPPSAGTLFHL